MVEAYSSDIRHLLGTMENFLLRAMEKVKVTKGSKHSYGLCGHTCDVKGQAGHLRRLSKV